MSDDKKTKDKESKDVTSEKIAPEEAGAGPPEAVEPASAPVERPPLTLEQAQRLRRKLKAKYH